MNNKVKRHPSLGEVINMEIGEGYSGGGLQPCGPDGSILGDTGLINGWMIYGEMGPL